MSEKTKKKNIRRTLRVENIEHVYIGKTQLLLLGTHMIVAFFFRHSLLHFHFTLSKIAF